MNPNAPLLVIAAGGTGGHMFPAQALAEKMLRRGWRVKLSTDERGARYTGGFPHSVEIETVASGTFARGGALAKAGVPLRLAGGTLSAVWKMRRDRPRVVVGFGGYSTVPAMAAARLLRLPSMVHEQNGILGRVNQYFAGKVSVVACGVWPTEMPEGIDAVHVGNPVRMAVAERAGAGYIPPGDYPMSLLVIGGSQGAKILSDVVPQAVADLPEALRRNLRVAHQARAEDVERVAEHYAGHGIDADVETFFHDIPRRMSEAQLVVARSGASTVADLSVIGRPSVLVPLAASIRDEQTANARGLVAAGAAILMPESRFTAGALSEQIALVLGDPAGAEQMARAALGQGRPEAAESLAALVEQLAGMEGHEE